MNAKLKILGICNLSPIQTMRIAVLTSSYPRFEGDGTAPFVQSLCEHLAKLGHDIEVVAPFDAAVDPSYRQDFPVHRFRYIWPKGLHIMGHARAMHADVRLRPLAIVLLPLFLISAFGALNRTIKTLNPDLIHVHWVLPNGPVAALAAALHRIPFVVSTHGSDMYLAQKSCLFGALARQVLRRAARVTACSQGLQRAAMEIGAHQEPHLIPWGADPHRFTPMAKDSNWLQRLNLNKDETIVIALGRLVPKKGFAVLLRAWAFVTQHFPKSVLVIGGDGPLKEELAQQAMQMNISHRVRFPGRIPWNQVPRFLSVGDLFVLPSVHDQHGNVDGLPTVLLEAMSCGLPVIASQIAGMPEVIIQNQNGVLVPTGDERAIAAAVIRLLSNDHELTKLGRGARSAVVSQHNWEGVAGAFTQIFDDIQR